MFQRTRFPLNSAILIPHLADADQRDMEQIDVVVLTKNSARTISQCLNSIRTCIPVSRIVVVDDSDDRGETLRIASKYTDQIYKFSGNIGEKRDHAIDLVVTPIFAYVDSDVVVNRAAFKRSMEILESDKSIAAVHNKGRPTDPRDFLSDGSHRNLTFGFALLRTAALKESRVPHQPKGEDAATGRRLQRLGYSIAWQDEFVSDHLRTLFEAYVHYFWYGKQGYFEGHPTYVIRKLAKHRNIKMLVLQLFLLAGYTEYRLRRIGRSL